MLALLSVMPACGRKDAGQPESAAGSGTEAESKSDDTGPESETPDTEPPAGTAVKNGEIYVLYTSDVHCGIDKGFGYAGLKQIRDTLESEGYTTILADAGDSIQGEPIGNSAKAKRS